MNLLNDLTTDMLFWLCVLAFFICTCIAGWMLALKSESFFGDYEAVFKETTSTNLGDMFLFVDAQKLFVCNIIAIIMLPLMSLMLFDSLVIAIGVFLLTLFLPFKIYRGMRKRRLAKIEKQLPDALIMISGSLAAGGSLNAALDSVVRDQSPPISQEFMLFTREQRIGLEFEKSLRNMERRIPVADFLMFTSAMKISREVGGDLGTVLNTLAETLRRKATMEGKIESLTGQGKMQGIVMTGLPILLGLLLYALEPEAMSKLFTTPIGWGFVSVIFVMEVLGYFFIQKVTTIDV